MEFKLKGVCAKSIEVEFDNDKITYIKVFGGCTGWDGSFVPKFCKGKTIDEVIEAFSGVSCGLKKTSCADQIAKVLRDYKLKQTIEV